MQTKVFIVLISIIVSVRALVFRSRMARQQIRTTILSARQNSLTERLGVGGGKNFLDTVFNRLEREKKSEKEKTEEDIMLETLDTKPWRANKVKHLPITYRPSKESWRERYRDPNDETIYLYAQPRFKPISASARLDDVWNWPWMWTKTKAERLAWIHKYFYAECERMTVQEHMELDAFFAEFDMPTRWGILRIKEFDVLNVFFLNLCFWTDFDGVRPTDLGLRPDGTVKTCSVQFHNCISSSNNPSDTDHYAPPFKWDRAKSPDQAYDEIKRVYTDYPKRGLKWSSGWIDRGGWDPQQFGGQYFYAQAHSLAFHYTDDIELKLDNNKREVQFRSSTRLGQADWDVERLRYNQFARMLNKKGGWEVQELPRLNWFTSTPFRWTQLTLDKTADTAERVANTLSMRIPSIARGGDSQGAARRALAELRAFVMPLLQPLLDEAGKVKDSVILEPRVAAALQALRDFEAQVEGSVQLSKQQAREASEKVLRLLPERFLEESPSGQAASDGVGLQDPGGAEALPSVLVEDEEEKEAGRAPRSEGLAPWRQEQSRGDDREESSRPTSQALIEDVVEQSDSLLPDRRKLGSSRPTPGEQRVLRSRFLELKKQINM